jgi:gliding motility-associated-like protein
MSTGCVSSATALTVNAVPGAPAAPTAGVTTQPACTTPTGTIVVTAPTGANIQYSVNGTTYQVSGTFSGLAPGSYNVTAQDMSTGCVSSATALTVNAVPGAPAAPTAGVTTQPTCTTPTGTIVVTAPTGANIQYSVDGTTYQASGTFSGLAPGSYNVTAQNMSTGCVSSATALTVNAVPGAPATPTASVTTQPTCTTPTGIIVVTAPTGANIQYSVDGTTYQASGTFSGLAPGSYNVTAQDMSTGCVSSATALTVNAVPNCPPNAVDDVATTNEDIPVVIDVTNNDTDTDGSIDDASVTIVSNPTNGTVTVNPTTGEITYTPNPGFNGTDSFTYSVCDNGTPLPAQCDQATVNVTINAVNDAPNAVDDVATTNEDIPVVIDVTNNDTDTDGSIDDASVTIVSNPTNGTVTVNPTTGEITYTPNPGFNGTDSFTYSVCDNGTPLPAQCDQATVIITVNAVNDAPNAVDDVSTTNEDTPVVIDVTNNDTDSDGVINDASVSIVTNPTNGTVTVNPTTGEVTYTPNPGFNGSDSFTYTVCDNGTPLPAQCDQATVTVTVNAVNDPPVVDNDANTITEDGGPATGDLTDTGDSDPDGTSLTANTTPVDGPNNGTITINSDGTYSYTPNAGFNGQDTIIVSVCDNGTPLPAICVNDTLIITVTPVNDAPNAVDDVSTTNEDTPVVIDVTNNDTDTDGVINDASVSIVTNPTNGTVTVNPTTGEVTYTPTPGFNGTDSFTYTVCDNGTPLPAQCDQATVTVTVNAVNNPPVVDNDANTITEDGGPATGDLTDTGDSDPDGTSLTANTTPVDGPNNGTITINSDGTYSYTPNAGFNGQDTIIVSVCDNGTPLPAICVNDTLIITVTPVNDAPNAVDDVSTTNEDTPVVIDVTNNDTDTDGVINDASVSIVTNPTNGTVTVNPTTGEVTYTPTPGFNGTDSFTYTVCDNGTPLPAQCDQATVTVTVNAVNNPPVVDNDANTITEDGGPATGDLTDTGDSDPDGTSLTANTTPVDGPNNGTITINGDGTYSYSPNAGFNGQDTIVVSVCDSGTPLPAICVNDTLIITVTPINDDLNATIDLATTNENVLVTINVVANDTDSDGNIDESALTVVDQPTNGSVTVNTITGQITYTPNNGFTGTDTLVYQICDDGTPLPATCDTAMVVITVLPCGTDLTADCDGDGVTNGEEIDPDGDGTPGPNGTDPSDPCSFNSTDQDLATVSQAWLDADCDGDGATNGEEIDPDGDGTPGPNGTDPSDPCSFNSTDQDLATVSQAWLDADCDGDGVTNGEEIDPDGDGTPGPNGTNPSDPCSFNSTDQDLATASQAWLDADCDGDGVTNGEEIDPDGDGTPGPNGTDPSDPCSFNSADQDLATVSQAWLDADCDGDGATNGEEIDPDGDGTPGPNGTDPSDPCSFNSADQDLATVSQAWLDADCDGDGATNGEEIDPDGDGTPGPNGTDPSDPCSFNSADQDLATVSQAWLEADCDGDGVTNGEEIDPDGDGTPGPNGTDPSDPCSFNSADQDLATVSQAWLDADCDGDGVTNGEEIDPDGDGTPGPNGTDPSDPCSFNSTDQDLATVSQAWLDADCDGDGATNGEEIDPDGDGTPGPNGTDPSDPCSFNSADQDLASVSQAWLNADCDGDGVTNGEEIDPDGDGTPGPNGTDPSDPCSFNSADQDLATVSQAWLDADCDGDGVTNGEEIDPDGDGTPGPNGTDPSDPCSFNSADQDLASVSQAWLNADCDGDGVTNGEEIDPDGDGTPGPNGTDPSDPCSFNSADQDLATVSQAWLDADCDGDGVTNDDEIAGGSNPLNPCDPNSCDTDITIPEAFTPDGDNTNETFVIPGIENYPKNKLTFMNRWGNEVFFTEGYDNTWDGTANRGIILGDSKLPTGTYYYILDLNGDGQTIFKGYVYLKR